MLSSLPPGWGLAGVGVPHTGVSDHVKTAESQVVKRDWVGAGLSGFPKIYSPIFPGSLMIYEFKCLENNQYNGNKQEFYLSQNEDYSLGDRLSDSLWGIALH